jgi:putative ATPase
LAASPKSNSAYLAIDEALALVEKTGNLPVPLHLRNSPTKLMKDLNYGKNYKYSHDFPNNFVAQQFLPDELIKQPIWKVQNNAAEKKLGEWLRSLWKNRF